MSQEPQFLLLKEFQPLHSPECAQIFFSFFCPPSAIDPVSTPWGNFYWTLHDWITPSICTSRCLGRCHPELGQPHIHWHRASKMREWSQPGSCLFAQWCHDGGMCWGQTLCQQYSWAWQLFFSAPRKDGVDMLIIDDSLCVSRIICLLASFVAAVAQFPFKKINKSLCFLSERFSGFCISWQPRRPNSSFSVSAFPDHQDGERLK